MRRDYRARPTRGRFGWSGLSEAPHTGHLENLLNLARRGAIIVPPVRAFCIRPKSVKDLVDHAVGRFLDLLDIDTDLPHRWREAENR